MKYCAWYGRNMIILFERYYYIQEIKKCINTIRFCAQMTVVGRCRSIPGVICLLRAIIVCCVQRGCYLILTVNNMFVYLRSIILPYSSPLLNRSRSTGSKLMGGGSPRPPVRACGCHAAAMTGVESLRSHSSALSLFFDLRYGMLITRSSCQNPDMTTRPYY
ncbi:hypothetical protein VTN77DRAFT_9528 [Rasamsonia byssochlamydoides]|uniref:uncharacterized protein n=1 Tax=Rasamsonia byssochlamydoides TaxID=89139 RepID=UPI00374336A1